MDQVNRVVRIARDPKQSKWLCPALLLADALLCVAVIWRVPCKRPLSDSATEKITKRKVDTEIDWTAYMQQIETYLKGETDYKYIKGDTGPLVYPGLHVYIYRLLYAITNQGQNILLGQVIFAGLYLASLATVMACYRRAKAPPYIYPLLILSKRLHSIFMLRLFNDCFTVFFLYLAIYFYQKKSWNLGSTALSCGLGIKMNILLVIPGLAFVLLQAIGFDRSITQGLIVSQSQGLFAYEFVRTNWRSYLYNAFQLNRQFFHKWTVNWRFVPETVFLSSTFSVGLLSLHAALLLLFATTRWTAPARRSLLATIKLILRDPESNEVDDVADRVTPDYIMTTLLTANAIGMLCARSLHYQFYSWTAWATPWLLWKAGVGPLFIYGAWAAQEWAWNVYPSTDTSSMVAVGCLVLQLVGVWWGTRIDSMPLKANVQEKEKKKP